DLRHHAGGRGGRDRARDRARDLPDVRDDRRRRDGPAPRMSEHGAIAAAEPVTAMWVALIPILPLAGALLLGLRGERLQKRLGKSFVGNVAVATVGGSFLLSLGAFFRLVGMDPEARAGGLIANLLPWIHVGPLNVDLAFQIDPLSSVMILVVTGI